MKRPWTRRQGWHSRTKDLKGLTFGRLTVLEFVGRENNSGRAIWKCLCGCGKLLEVNGSRLKSGNVKSCGCLKRDSCIERSTIHGETNTYFWKTWRGIKHRCNDISSPSYKYYGARGITYDPRWEDYSEFRKDMYEAYKAAVRIWGSHTRISIERLNVNGNYEKSNCTFIPLSMQPGNTRRNNWMLAIDPNGKEYCTKNKKAFAKRFGLQTSGIYCCLNGIYKHHKHWTFKRLEFKRLKLKRINNEGCSSQL